MIQYIMVHNKDGRVRLNRWYNQLGPAAVSAVYSAVRSALFSGVQEFQHDPRALANGECSACGSFPLERFQVVYRFYGELAFVCGIDEGENALSIQELLQVISECAYGTIGSISEADLLINFQKFYAVLDEIIQGGLVVNTNQEDIIKYVKSLTFVE